MLDQVGQARLDRVVVEVVAHLGQGRRDLGGGLIGQKSGQARGEEPHDRDVLGGFFVDRVAQRLEPDPVDEPLRSVGLAGHAGHPKRVR